MVSMNDRCWGGGRMGEGVRVLECWCVDVI